MASESQVARNFQNNALNPELITVPGIGRASIEILKKQGIVTTDQLVGQFFLCDRDEVQFIGFLEEMGIQNKYARETARQFVKKFGNF